MHLRQTRRQALRTGLGWASAAGVALLTACGTGGSAASSVSASTAAPTTSAASALTSAVPSTSTAASSSAAASGSVSATSASSASAPSTRAASVASSTATSTAAVSATQSSAPVAASSRAAGSAGTLTVWMSNDSFSLTSGIGAELMKGFLPGYPGLTLEATSEGSLDKFKTQVAGGTPPDLFHTQSYVQTTWGVTGVVQPLDTFVSRSKNVKPADVWKYKWDEVAWQGKTYALPYSVDNRVIYDNDDMYRKAGLDPAKPPATWSDMESAVTKTVQQSGQGLAQLGWDPFGGSGGRLTWLVPFWQLGGDFAPGDGSKVDIANDNGVTSLEWTSKMYDLQGGYQAVQDFAKAQSQGDGIKLFYTSHTTHLYGTIATKAQYLLKVPDLTYHVAQYPLPPNGKVATYAGGWAMCIATGAKNASTAFALMDYLYQPDVQVKWAVAQLRVPPSMSVARSVDYTKNDPLLQLTVDAMPNGRFVPSIPGGEQILNILNTGILNVLQKKIGASQGLQDTQRLCQVELDKYRK